MARLLADRMLEGLARRLRLAGYDCAMPAEVFRTPQAILEHARAAGRVLLSTSGRLDAMARPGELLLVPEGSLAAQVSIVIKSYPIDFEQFAFTRCSRDNTPLEAVDWERIREDLPPRVREAGLAPVRRCPSCGRLYWPGSHCARLRRQFQGWTGLDL